MTEGCGAGGGRTGGEDDRTRSGDTRLLAWLGPDEPDIVASIHATVELERALRELGAAPPARPPLPDVLLGAAVVVVERAGGGLIAAAEPTTEGRLAAFLARHGEGWAGRYVRSPVVLADARRLAADAGIALSRTADGPFGRAVLVLGGPAGGPQLILVEPPAVPSRP